LLRYYEEQGLIAPSRGTNGYREYDQDAVDRVRQIRGLLDAGMPTRIIREILPCLESADVLYCPTVTPDLVETLERERERMSERIRILARNRDAITRYLDAIPAP
jgi:DNA-binding transcriptional MerR regulator